MTEEEKSCSCDCICKSELFKKFIIVTVGTFIGAFLALTLFAALHRPPMPCPMMPPYMYPPMQQMYHFNKGGDFHKGMKPHFDMQKPANLK